MASLDILEQYLGKFFLWCEKNIVLVFVFLFCVTLAVRYGFTFTAWQFFGFPFQRYDPYMYMVKGVEIADGNFLPIRTHGLGWPVILGGVFRIWGVASVFENLIVASTVATIFSALSFFPFMYIAGRLDSRPRQRLLCAFFFATSFLLTLPENDSIAMADPLFVFLFLISLCFLYKAREDRTYMFLSGVFAGMAYFIKPVGLFLIPISILSYAVWTRPLRRSVWGLLLFLSAFIALSAPFLWHRYAAFGSMFNYGENSKQLAATYTDAWGEAVSSISLGEYFTHNTVGDYSNKFLIGGFFFVFAMLLAALMPYFFGLVDYFAHTTSVSRTLLYPVWIAFAVWVIGLAPVFHIYGNPRHVVPIVALCVLMGALGLGSLAGRALRPNIAYAAMLFFSVVFFIIPFLMAIFFSKEKHIVMRDGALWARDIAPRLRGAVAMGNGADVLMAQYSDSRVGGRGMLDMYAPVSGVSVRYPGKFDSVEDFRWWLKARNITYVIFDDVLKESFPFAPDKYLSIYTGVDFPPYLVPFYSNYESNSQWKIRVFKVNWDLL